MINSSQPLYGSYSGDRHKTYLIIQTIFPDSLRSSLYQISHISLYVRLGLLWSLNDIFWPIYVTAVVKGPNAQSRYDIYSLCPSLDFSDNNPIRLHMAKSSFVPAPQAL